MIFNGGPATDDFPLWPETRVFRESHRSLPEAEVAPPGREDQVKALKKKVGVPGAFKIAWDSYGKAQKKRKHK